jgi:hypothetical protein
MVHKRPPEGGHILFLKTITMSWIFLHVTFFFGKQKQGTWFGILNMRNIN